MISEPTKLSKNDLAEITYHEDNVIPKDIKKTRKSKKTAKSEPSIIEEHFARRMEARTRTPRIPQTQTEIAIANLDETTCQNPDCTALCTNTNQTSGLCSDCYQATVMTRRTPSRR